jgi:hypothetical protein
MTKAEEVKLVEMKIEFDTFLANKNEVKKKLAEILTQCGASNILIYMTYKEMEKKEDKK